MQKKCDFCKLLSVLRFEIIGVNSQIEFLASLQDASFLCDVPGVGAWLRPPATIYDHSAIEPGSPRSAVEVNQFVILIW